MCVCVIRDLSDVDKDGRLSLNEFVIAMQLTEKAKQGIPVPHTLPAELSPTNTASKDVAPGSPSVFEEKRKQNFEQGRLELEKRRRAIQEQEDKERVSHVMGCWGHVIYWWPTGREGAEEERGGGEETTGTVSQ